jgi:hypothetical protein
MKALLRTLVAAIVMVSPVAAQSPPSGKSAVQAPAGKATAKAPDYYPLKPGTTWHYQLDTGDGQKRQLTSQIAGVDNVDGKDLARLQVFADGQALATEHLASTDRGVFRVRMNNVDVSPPICLIKYPLKTGQSWGGETESKGEKMKVDCSEGKPEEVKVPAGTYQAIPCTIVVTAGPQKYTNVFWFAENVGIVKQRSEIPGPVTVVMELTKFEAAK